MKTIACVKNKEVLKLTGPITISGDIDDDAQIEVDKGTLLVLGKVGKNVTITCTAEKTTSSYGGFVSFGRVIVNGVQIGGNSEGSGFVTIEGDIAENVTVNCDGDFTCKGNIADHFTVETHNADINLSDIGAHSNVTSHNGNISARTIGQNSNIKNHNGSIVASTAKQNSQLIDYNGNITLGTAEAHTTVKSYNGNVMVATADQTATVKTTNGHAFANGRRVEQPNAHGSSVQVSNMVISGNAIQFGFGSSGSGRIVVGGVDVTDYVKQNQNANNNRL